MMNNSLLMLIEQFTAQTDQFPVHISSHGDALKTASLGNMLRSV